MTEIRPDSFQGRRDVQSVQHKQAPRQGAPCDDANLKIYEAK